MGHDSLSQRDQEVYRIDSELQLPWFIFGLPHERSCGIPDTVGGQEDSIRGDLLRVSRCHVR